MAKNLTKKRDLPALPERSKATLVKAESDHTAIALLEFQSPTAALISQPAPFMARMNLWLLGGLILSMVAVIFFIKVDMVVTSLALTVSRLPTSIVQPLETSVVKSILVHEGQSVKAGDLLGELDPTFSGSDEKATTAQALSLKAQVARLRAEIDNRPYVADGTDYSQAQAALWQQRQGQFMSHSDSLKQKIESTRFKMEQLRADEKGLTDRLPLAREVEAKRRELEKLQVGSQLNTLAAADARIQVEATLANVRQQLQGAQRDLAGAISDLNDYVHQWFSETSDQLATQERALSDMTGQSTKNNLRRQLVELRAPQDAVVLSVSKVSLGSVIQSGDELMRLVPTDSAIDVEGMIAGSDAGFIKVGDPVAIKFDTLPHIVYGFAEGTVQHVSADSFANVQPPNSGTMTTQPSIGTAQPQTLPGTSPLSYRVRTSIDEFKMRGVPPTFRIMPGMPVTADINVGKRSVFQYFFERLVPTFTEGMREPS